LKWVRFTISTKSEAVEAIIYALNELKITGIEIEDPNDIATTMKNKIETDWDYIDEELLKDRDMNEVLIKVYFPEHTAYGDKIIQIKEKLAHINEFLDIGKGTIQVETMEEEEWANSWKKYYKPIKIGKNIIIKPSWEQYDSLDDDEIIIEMDPGMAFGTGTHETTSMCIEFLEKFLDEGDVVFDIGCGSGILGITAAKLGAARVTGVDLDSNAVKVARDNVAFNGAEHIMEIYEGDLMEVINDKANILVANIIADVIIKLSSCVPKFLKHKGLFIASGIIKERLQEVEDAVINNGFDIIDIYEKGEWCAVAAKL